MLQETKQEAIVVGMGMNVVHPTQAALDGVSACALPAFAMLQADA